LSNAPPTAMVRPSRSQFIALIGAPGAHLRNLGW
jgi:hypothetical protein